MSVTVPVFNLRTWQVEARGIDVQGQLQLHIEFEASPRYMEPWQSKTKAQTNPANHIQTSSTNHIQTSYCFLGIQLEIKIKTKQNKTCACAYMSP